MIGIYKIENTLNHKIYVGQSVHIERRWSEHCFPSKKSVISKAIQKYGKEKFTFQILEECSVEELDEKESYYIKKFNCVIPNGYNVVDCSEGNHTLYSYYRKDVLLDIIQDLEASTLSIQDISEKYDLNKTTIYRINNGEIHRFPDKNYPIRKVMQRREKQYCECCSVEISHGAKLCAKCYALSQRKTDRPIREELKKLIRITPFTKIGEMYGVTDNAIRKWCKSYNLPYKTSEIKKINDQEWEQI